MIDEYIYYKYAVGVYAGGNLNIYVYADMYECIEVWIYGRLMIFLKQIKKITKQLAFL